MILVVIALVRVESRSRRARADTEPGRRRLVGIGRKQAAFAILIVSAHSPATARPALPDLLPLADIGYLPLVKA
jgi:hypothetical protein